MAADLAGYIDTLGIHVPTYPEILGQLKAYYRSIFGQDLYLEADSQEGQMLAMFALAIHDSNQLAVSVYNAFSPYTAQGAGLSRMVKINGIARKAASRSTVDLTLLGQPGTQIVSGVVQDVAGQSWRLPAMVTIPVSGLIVVTATAAIEGDLQAAAGEVSSIATPTRGWQSATNAQAATPGAPVETDAALRQRQAVSTALPSRSVLEGIAGAVANIAGVTRLKALENDTDTPSAEGIPAHHMTIVVEGGDDAEIAAAVAVKKTPGTGTHGATAVAVTDAYGMPNTIRFFRPTVVAVDVALTIKAKPGYLAATGEDIKANLADYLNTLEIGEDVLLSKLYTPINAAEPDATRKTFDVTALAMARHGGAAAAANLELTYIEAAKGMAANVILTVV